MGHFYSDEPNEKLVDNYLKMLLEQSLKHPEADFFDSLDVDKFKSAAAAEGLDVLPDWTKVPIGEGLFTYSDPIFLGDPWTCWKTETQWRTDAMSRN